VPFKAPDRLCSHWHGTWGTESHVPRGQEWFNRHGWL